MGAAAHPRGESRRRRDRLIRSPPYTSRSGSAPSLSGDARERRVERIRALGWRCCRAARGRGRGERTAAVIDLGSNSWRLVVYAYVPGAPWRRIGELNEPVRIAAGLERHRPARRPRRSRAGWRRSRCSRRYCRRAAWPRQAVDVVATSAIRDAANGAELSPRAASRPGSTIEVLSAEEEARYGYVAAVNSTTLADGAVLDLGGGSLQLVARRGPPRRGVRLVAARRRPRHRAAAPRRRPRHAQGAQARPRGRRERARDAGWLARRRPRAWSAWAARSATSPPRPAARGGRAAVQGSRLEARELRELDRPAGRRCPPAERALPGIKAGRARHRARRRARARGGARARRLRRASRSPAPVCARASSSAAACSRGGEPLLRRRARGRDPQPRAAVRRRHPPRRPRRPARAQLHDSLAAAGRDRPRAGRAGAAVGRGAAARRRHDRRLRRRTPTTRST